MVLSPARKRGVTESTLIGLASGDELGCTSDQFRGEYVEESDDGKQAIHASGTQQSV